MSSTADGRYRSLKLLTSGLELFKARTSIASQTTGRGGAGNATTDMPPPSGNSSAEDGIRSPVGRDLRSVPKNGQILKTGRGGAGNTMSANASKRRVLGSQTRAALAAEREVVQKHKREQAGSSPLVTGRGGVGNIRRSKQNKPKLSPTLPRPHRSSTPKTQLSSISSLVLDISPEASTSSLSRPRGSAFRKRHQSFSGLSISEPGGTTLSSLSREGPEMERSSSTADSSFTGYVIPESTFGALAEAHDGSSLNHLTSVSSRCFAGSLNPSLTGTDRSRYHQRLPSSVAPFEEPPMLFYPTPITASSSQQSRRRSVGTNPPVLPRGSGSRPLTERTSASSNLLSPFDKYYTPGSRTGSDPVIVLPPEQAATPISPLSPPPRFSFATSDSTPALSPRSPLSAGFATKPAGYRATLDKRGLGERSGSTRDSSYGPSIADSATGTKSGRFDNLQEVALRRLGAAATPIPRIPDPDQYGTRFIPLGHTVKPSPRLARTVKAKLTLTTTAVDSPTRPIKIPDTPPRIPISIFVDPPSRSHSVAGASPTSPLASSFRSSSPASSPVSQYESFTPTFGTTPLPPLPAVSRRTTYTSIAPSEYTYPSPPTSPTSH